MLHLLYILAFTLLAFVAVRNLIRNLIQFSTEPPVTRSSAARTLRMHSASPRESVPHPEFLDDEGKVVSEPLLVMRSISVEDAREKLDALYEASPSVRSDRSDEEG